jgi:TonB family protein
MKPANILAVNDQLKISSDGLRQIGESSGVSGTPSVYDPPELAGGEISPAGDVWSLGMTLVEALTQRLPVWERTGREEPVVPKTLPAPFLDLAHHCLLRDPQRRCTVADIAARLGQSTLRTQTPAGPQKALAKRHYIALAVALALALAAILVGSRLLKPPSDAVRAPSADEQPKRQPKPAGNLVTSQTGQSNQGTNGEKPAPSSAVPPPLRSEALAQTPALGSAPGKVVHQVLPDVPLKARETIRGKVKVRVKVSVDASGNVAAMLDTPGPSRYFAGLALQAARRWKFAPAKVDGQDVSSEWLLRFEFSRTGTTAFPARIGP